MGRRQNDSARPPEVRPVDVDGVRTVAIVTVGWGVAFVALALRQGQLNDAGRGWWLWASLAGVGLGLLGLEYCRKRRDAIAQAALEAEAEEGEFEDESAVGDWSRLPPEDPDFGVVEDPQPAEPQVSAEADHVTQQAEQPPGYTTGDMPAVPGQAGQPVTGYPGSAYAHGTSSHSEYTEPHTPPPPPAEPPPSGPPAPPRHYEPPPRPVERPRPQPAPPPAPAPQQQPTMPTEAGPSRPAAQRPAPPQQAPPSPAQQPPQHPQPPPQPPPAPPHQAPSPQPEPAPQDPYSTGADWYDSAAGYTPDADRARRHPRDRRPETSAQSDSAAESPVAGRERQSRRTLEDSEFFGDDSSKPPPNSTAEFLLADLESGDDEPASPARHDRDAPDEEYRGRRTRRSR